MQDGIIAGNGNSRYLKTVSEALSLYPTYQDFIAALIAGTFPIDLNGINAAGWTQQGTALNKANLLTDSTATLFGLGSNAVPNDVLAKVKTLLDGERSHANTKAFIKIGSYIGTDTYGKNNPTSLSLDFPIGFVWIFAQIYPANNMLMTTNKDYHPYLSYEGLTTSYQENFGLTDRGDLGTNYGKISPDGKTIYWYSTYGPGEQYNSSMYKYLYMLISR